jgi:hypothetical protein
MVKKNILVLSIFFAVVISLAILVWAAAPPAMSFNSINGGVDNLTYSNATRIINITNSTTYSNTTWWYNGTANLTYCVEMGCALNWTLYNFSEGSHLIIAYGRNDSTGSLGTINSSWRYFTIDTLYPQWGTLPANITITFGQNLSSTGVQFLATDANRIDTYVIDNSSFVINSTGYLNNSLLLKPGTYTINVTVNDSGGNSNSSKYTVIVSKATSNITLTINGTDGNLTINPGNVNAATNATIKVTMNSPSTSLGGNLSLWLNGALLSYNISAADASIKNYSNFTVGYYNITAIYNGSTNYTGITKVWWVRYDITAPTITLSSASINTTSPTTVNITYNVSDVTSPVDNCTLIINSMTGQSSTSITQNTTQEFSEYGTLGVGTYSYLVTCTDSAGNVANSSSKSLTIEDVGTVGTTGGSTGGGNNNVNPWTNTWNPTDSQLILGYAGSLKAKERVTFVVDSKNHYVGLKSLTSTTATFEIASTPINVTMSVGETKKFDVTEDGYYDIKVTLNSIVNSKANVTVQKIYEQIPVVKEGTVGEQITDVVDDVKADVKSVDKMTWIIIVAIIIVLIILIVLISKSSRKKRYYKKGY